jgi:murein DD-endopeptidase MepM/ murein hydrolase activator NlpD
MPNRRCAVVAAAALLLTVAPALLLGGTLSAVAAPAPPRASGRWVAPLSGPLDVTTPFRPPAVRWGAGHRGVDLAGSARAEVRAAGSGRIAYAGRLAGRGVVAVAHGALRTTYEPLEASLRVGDVVARGNPIGRLTAGHDPARPARYILHWGVRRGETYLDPMSLLGARPVRLLPRWGSAGAAGGGGPDAAGHQVATAATGRARGATAPRPRRRHPTAVLVGSALLFAVGRRFANRRMTAALPRARAP